MLLRRLIQLMALIMIGDGVTGFFKPRWHSLLWDIGPQPFRAAMEKLAENPEAARIMYAAEIGIGSWLASRQLPPRSV